MGGGRDGVGGEWPATTLGFGGREKLQAGAWTP